MTRIQLDSAFPHPLKCYRKDKANKAALVKLASRKVLNYKPPLLAVGPSSY